MSRRRAEIDNGGSAPNGGDPARIDGHVVDIAEDAPDLRDLLYRPSLRPLPKDYFLKAKLQRLTEKVRDQKREGSCAGQALAVVIDCLRESEIPPPEPVPWTSARMIYELARRIDERGTGGNAGPPAGDGVISLRSALKAFYHHGVCLDEHWPYDPKTEPNVLTRARSKEARKLALGAYFRLQPVMNDYHAALVEAGAVLAAAHVHSGWEEKAVKHNHGRIIPGAWVDGRHAFAIVGYDKDGFLVLNSWGPSWGGFAGVAGLAHWSYQDWAESISDAWVLRLAVSTPDAFDFSVGLQGSNPGLAVPIASISTSCIDVIGHYIHLDDGQHVGGGPYPSSPESLAETVALLEEKAASGGTRGNAGARPPEGEDAGASLEPGLSQGSSPEQPGGSGRYRHVVLWLAGANETLKDAVTDAARLKRQWMRRGVYPIFVFWCSDFVEDVIDVVDGAITRSLARVGRTGPALDRLVEANLRGAGRAFLRDIKHASRVAADPRSGAMAAALEQLGRLRPAYKLHLVAEGVGAILAADLALGRGSERAGRPAGLDEFDTVSLAAPALTEKRFRQLLRVLRRRGGPTVTILTANRSTESRMRVGPYGQFILHLVDRAFEEDVGAEKLLGLVNVAARLAKEFSSARRRVRFRQVVVDEAVEEPKIHHVTRGTEAIGMIENAWGVESCADHRQLIVRSRHARAL